MSDDGIRNYNYDSFTAENYQPMMRFHESPPLAKEAPDFPLWQLENGKVGAETSLQKLWSTHRYLVVEFGSFT